MVKELKHKAPKTKVSLYDDNKLFSVSASHGFVKQIEKENSKSFTSFMKATSATSEPMVEESTISQVVEASSDHQEGQTA